MSIINHPEPGDDAGTPPDVTPEYRARCERVARETERWAARLGLPPEPLPPPDWPVIDAWLAAHGVPAWPCPLPPFPWPPAGGAR